MQRLQATGIDKKQSRTEQEQKRQQKLNSSPPPPKAAREKLQHKEERCERLEAILEANVEVAARLAIEVKVLHRRLSAEMLTFERSSHIGQVFWEYLYFHVASFFDAEIMLGRVINLLTSSHEVSGWLREGKEEESQPVSFLLLVENKSLTASNMEKQKENAAVNWWICSQLKLKAITSSKNENINQRKEDVIRK